ncbi:VPS30 (YPL120W) [Zygosaccharomyces parabailii]|uniref:ZYBA0S10-03444g1_1 n=1 Tax=Zygosaccharomyces bailii (strain CLIB 213 / ATCC 58445 / CBS 680 / BCRC 21525 / NBRC 1098 / NCYC 1416 / NRRL Y-2227) TaxID=1333698 RepID=A0A8J2TC49_ZYGB2|nr:VPS30 (YPL120W) [Zygosaccharomyces parabailii]CDF91266.1 ZYBA0S10-03444g1_1 [Zygosaccharomyces bailii CLIB 213]
MKNADDPILKCQNCQLPLEIDSSLLDLSLAQRDMLVNFSNDYSPSTYKIPNDRLQRLNKVVSPTELNLQSSVLDSYVFLQGSSNEETSTNQTSLDTSAQTTFREEDSGDEPDENQPSHPTARTLSTQVTALANVFNVLSSKTNIDYPVCEDCCNILIQRLRSEYDDAIKERDTYKQFLSRIEKQKIISSSDSPDVTSEEINRLKNEREELFQELLQLEQQDEDLDEEIAVLEADLELKKQHEEKELKKKNIEDLEQLEFSKEVRSLKNQYELTLNNLDKLRKINIYNETFKISHEGPFGVINGLRIGGFDNATVPWNEINAALGQIILLLATISARLKMKLEGYKLQPMGSFSTISKFNQESQEWETYDVFSNENFKLGRFLRKETNFDKAMESILSVIQQMALWLSRSAAETNEIFSNSSRNDVGLDLPYLMHKDKINGNSVKLFGAKPNMEWTIAMKFLLTNAKWLLAYSSSRLV